MWTGVYYPNDAPFTQCYYYSGDITAYLNPFAINEGPSYCVRLIVFEMPEEGSMNRLSCKPKMEKL